MFSLENELQKRLDIIAKKDALVAKKEELEIALGLVNEELDSTDYEELASEVLEIKRLMGIDEEVVEEENIVE